MLILLVTTIVICTLWLLRESYYGFGVTVTVYRSLGVIMAVSVLAIYACGEPPLAMGMALCLLFPAFKKKRAAKGSIVIRKGQWPFTITKPRYFNWLAQTQVTVYTNVTTEGYLELTSRNFPNQKICITVEFDASKLDLGDTHALGVYSLFELHKDALTSAFRQRLNSSDTLEPPQEDNVEDSPEGTDRVWAALEDACHAFAEDKGISLELKSITIE